jgi:lipopolysaccharide transport system ATP-binding protein
MSPPKSSEPATAPAIVCRNVVKRFYYYEHRTESLRELFRRSVLHRPIHVRHPEFALTGLDLTVGRGESLVIVGRNGSGKSTILRLMAGVYQPSEGVIETHGTVTAVIELGAGFQPELTGEENVELYGAILGLPRGHIGERFEEIIAFADIGDFIATPVKYYSSGMKARLAFAVAICVRPDILLLDEVLAVGDFEFQERCIARLKRFNDEGGTLVAVSHDLGAVRYLCSRAVWIDHGHIVMDGPVDSVAAAYHSAAPAEGAG